MSKTQKKLAIVYDWLDSAGGAERLLEHVSDAFPDADWFTAHGSSDSQLFKKLNPRTSFMQNLPHFIQNSRIICAPLYPFAFESFDFSKYETVLSITSSFAKGIVTRPETKHISYVFAPTKFLWGERSELYSSGIVNFASKPFIKHLKKWDLVAAQRPDEIVTLSEFSRLEIEKYYHQDAKLVYPPFDRSYWEDIVKNFGQEESGEYYLLVSRLEPHKNIEMAINACRKLKKKLIIVGDGSQFGSLKQKSDSFIHFFGRVSDEKLAHLYHNAQALLMPQIEDFGYVSLEAQICGCPVITYAKSGAVETIVEGKTGFTYPDNSVTSLINALEKYEPFAYTVKHQMSSLEHTHINKFSPINFTKELHNIL